MDNKAQMEINGIMLREIKYLLRQNWKGLRMKIAEDNAFLCFIRIYPIGMIQWVTEEEQYHVTFWAKADSKDRAQLLSILADNNISNILVCPDFYVNSKKQLFQGEEADKEYQKDILEARIKRTNK